MFQEVKGEVVLMLVGGLDVVLESVRKVEPASAVLCGRGGQGGGSDGERRGRGQTEQVQSGSVSRGWSGRSLTLINLYHCKKKAYKLYLSRNNSFRAPVRGWRCVYVCVSAEVWQFRGIIIK